MICHCLWWSLLMIFIITLILIITMMVDWLIDWWQDLSWCQKPAGYIGRQASCYCFVTRCVLQDLLYPASAKLKAGYTGFTLSIHPSVPPSVRPSVHSSVDGIMCAMYLQQYLLDTFHIYTYHQTTSEGVLCVKLVTKFRMLNFWHIC